MCHCNHPLVSLSEVWTMSTWWCTVLVLIILTKPSRLGFYKYFPAYFNNLKFVVLLFPFSFAFQFKFSIITKLEIQSAQRNIKREGFNLSSNWLPCHHKHMPLFKRKPTILWPLLIILVQEATTQINTSVFGNFSFWSLALFEMTLVKLVIVSKKILSINISKKKRC